MISGHVLRNKLVGYGEYGHSLLYVGYAVFKYPMKVTASLTAVPTKLVHFLTDDLSLRCTGNDPRKVRNFSTKS